MGAERERVIDTTRAHPARMYDYLPGGSFLYSEILPGSGWLATVCVVSDLVFCLFVGSVAGGLAGTGEFRV
jgi:hypothetical protein